VESPAGVGFSYSSKPTVDYIIDDNQTALDNYNFLVNFFANYSEYRANDFYIT
jgi:serine carboxypeptidase-like clade 2